MKRARLGLGIILVTALIAGNAWLYFFKPVVSAEDLVFNTINGESFSYNKMVGKPVLITFWASSCGVCLADIPQLTALHQRYAEQGLQMYSVAMPYDKSDKVKAMAEDLPFHIVLDEKGVINNAFGRVMFTPTNFLIDTKGDVTIQEVGPFDLAKFEAEIKKMI